MPQSKKRPHSHPQHHSEHVNHPKETKKSNAVIAGIVFFSLIGLGISLFLASTDILWLIVWAVVGAVGGYFFGHEIDKAFSK